ncbi:hypothetical protein GCM10007036_14550 [Alsobacter metallidurans]|uniref:Phage tail protein n=1 Tax=Alsobacter metallidurans TaxID=340221 RepID=A0A917I609_9HYPH|nr:phage tail protein [Alsobacter metallidurans]GGH14917.1 hypothetical protein GCM10007036_14550 [Alsobacter metallidurans]
MPDLYHFWGSDLVAGSTGDVRTVDGSTLGTQRVLRRLLTNPGDLIWHPEYGAGLPRLVGELLDLPALTALIRSQIFLEDAVAPTPEPTITVSPIANGVSVYILYADAQTGQQITLSFDVSS